MRPRILDRARSLLITRNVCRFTITGSSATPVEVTGVSDVVAVAAGEDHALALESDGTMWAWGYNDAGQIGPEVAVDPLSPSGPRCR